MAAGWPDDGSGQLPPQPPAPSFFEDNILPFDDFETFNDGPSSFNIPQQPYQNHPSLNPAELTLDAFFNSNGGWRPPEPCNYCKKMRLQCFMLQTTTANPNPVSSCSSCVALFRQCSLAEKAKRHHSEFETSAPVIGQLHGVNEEGGDGTIPDEYAIFQPQFAGQQSLEQSQELSLSLGQSQTSEAPRPAGKRMSARMVKRTRALRNWYARHQEHPYPTDEEKSILANESGLSRTQVTNWFTNARRRQRQSMRATATSKSFFPLGSPMPQHSPQEEMMTPLERWRNSPPEAEAVCPGALKNALDDLEQDGSDAVPGPYRFGGNARTYSSGSVSQASSYQHGQYGWMEASSQSGASSVHSRQSVDIFPFAAAGGDGGYSSGEASLSGARHSTAAAAVATAGQGSRKGSTSSASATALYCTFCWRKFKKKSDWVRHERTIHLPDLDSWICSIANPLTSTDSPAQSHHLTWRIDNSKPECTYCGHLDPSIDHLRSHEFESCAERPVQERSFARKDHLWQHLQKFHGCKKWTGWTMDLNAMQVSNDEVKSRCGFCGLVLESWKARAQHVAAHFRSGLGRGEWKGGSGVEGYGTGTTQVKIEDEMIY